MRSPFLSFEDTFHTLSAAVAESTGKLSPLAAETVALLATVALFESFVSFCDGQRQNIAKLRPTLVKVRGARENASGLGIDLSYKRLVGKSVLTVKEAARIRFLAFACGGNPWSTDHPKRAWLLEWPDTSQFIFDVGVKITRETGIAAKRGLDPKNKQHAKRIAAINQLLMARFDNLE